MKVAAQGCWCRYPCNNSSMSAGVCLQVAIKTLHKQQKAELVSFVREMETLLTLHHDYIIRVSRPCKWGKPVLADAGSASLVVVQTALWQAARERPFTTLCTRSLWASASGTAGSASLHPMQKAAASGRCCMRRQSLKACTNGCSCSSAGVTGWRQETPLTQSESVACLHGWLLGRVCVTCPQGQDCGDADCIWAGVHPPA